MLLRGRTPSYTRLNAPQKAAVEKGLTNDRVTLLHGPPGTGKSETLVALLEIMGKAGLKVLVCAEANNPVDILLTKFAKTDTFASDFS